MLLPDALDGKIAILLVAFRRSAQAMVDSWMESAQERYGDDPDIALLEVPMLGGGWRMISGFIDDGMRAGIPAAHHDLVATCYGDASRFRQELGIDDPSVAHVFLLRRDGGIVWRTSAFASPASLAALHAQIEQIRRN